MRKRGALSTACAFLLLASVDLGLTARTVAGAEPLPRLTLNREVQALSRTEAAREYPVHVRATITYLDSGTGVLFVQDRSAGIFVFIQQSHAESPLRAGQFIDLQGVTTPGEFSPCITKARIRVLGTRPMPEPKPLFFNPLLGGTEDARWIRMEGVVRTGEVRKKLLLLNIAAQGGNFLVITPDFDENWESQLVNSRISVTGVLAANFNDQHQSVAFRVFVPFRKYIRIDSPAPANSFDVPLTSTLGIGQYHPQWEPGRRVRVRGTLLAVEPGEGMYLSDGEGSLQIEESSGCDAHPGDLIEGVGFPAAVHGRPGLQDSICRKVGRGSVPLVIPVTAEQVLPDFSYSADNGWVSAGIPYDMKMVTTIGQLIESFPGPDGETWSLEASGRNFIAKLPLAGRQSIKAGSRVRLTGLCVLTYDRYRRVQFFRILVPDWRDVSLVSRPSWWNLQLALWGVGSSMLACLFALAWVYLLRTQVRLQTVELKRANTSLTRLSNLDALTGVANRRYFEETLEAEVLRARRSDQHVSLLMVDVDYFKGINDSYGHLKGDECLINIARALETVPRRSTDFVARFGGEEFTVILLSDENGARTVAESTRRRVADLAVPNPGSPFRVVTISIGSSTLKPGSKASSTDLISAADRSLYEAKRMGRNQLGPVCEPVVERELTEHRG